MLTKIHPSHPIIVIGLAFSDLKTAWWGFHRWIVALNLPQNRYISPGMYAHSSLLLRSGCWLNDTDTTGAALVKQRHRDEGGPRLLMDIQRTWQTTTQQGRRNYKAAKGKFLHKLPHWIALLENCIGKGREWQIGKGLELNDGISSHIGHVLWRAPPLATPLGIEIDVLSWEHQSYTWGRLWLMHYNLWK